MKRAILLGALAAAGAALIAAPSQAATATSTVTEAPCHPTAAVEVPCVTTPPCTPAEAPCRS
jgi:hypothetical protein